MKMEKRLRFAWWLLLELVSLGTLLCVLPEGWNEGLLLACMTPFLLLLPRGVEKILQCRICLPAYLVVLAYVIGPMLGQCWKLYYLTNWWDKLLHITAGVLFALLGWFLYLKLGGDEKKHWLQSIFAVCFSVSIAVIWEFWEFGADQLLGMDMQNDTVVTGFASYDLGRLPGEVGYIRDVREVVIDGNVLPFSGYLDIGLIDTMWDMLLESLGAFAAVILTVALRGKYICFRAEQ